MGVSENVSRHLQEIALDLTGALNEAAGERVVWSLFVWTPGRANYISNAANREDIITALETVLENWKQGAPDVPAHKLT